MSYLTFEDAFRRLGAKPINSMWAVSSLANDGALVMSCWNHYFGTPKDGVLPYCDGFSRWKGNMLGMRLLKQHIELAIANDLPVRGIVATAKKPDEVESSTDASKIKKKFHILEGKVGRLTAYDGDKYVIEFRMNAPLPGAHCAPD